MDARWGRLGGSPAATDAGAGRRGGRRTPARPTIRERRGAPLTEPAVMDFAVMELAMRELAVRELAVMDFALEEVSCRAGAC